MVDSACSQCGEKVLPEWIVCPVCTHPRAANSGQLACLQCNGQISADHLICPHCHVPIIRRYCGGCKRLIPDHTVFCPYCGSGRTKKSSLRRLLQYSTAVAASGLIIFAGYLLLPDRSPKASPQTPPAAAIPQSFAFQQESLIPHEREPVLTSSTPPFTEADLSPLLPANSVEDVPVLSAVKRVSYSETDLAKRGARLKQGRKLNQLGTIYIRRGKYKEAAIVLQQAVDSFPPETRDVSYGESLYHFGLSLRMSGKAAEAIPFLKRAMAFPLYSSKAEKELKTASSLMKKSR